MHFRQLIILFIFLIIAPAVVFSGSSEEKPDTIRISGIHHLEAIEIHAMRESGLISTLPVTAGVLDKELIREQNLHSISETGTLVPNLFIPDYGSRLTTPVYIRGVGSRIKSPSVGLYVDDIPYFEKSVFDFDLINTERIEVLRGPQGTLYGRNTMGGLIRVYSPSPFSHQGSTLEVSGGNSAFFNTGLSHGLMLGDNTAASLNFGLKRHDGYFENSFTGSNADDHFSTGGRLRVASQVSSALLLELISHYEYLDQGGYPYAIFDRESNTSMGVNYNQPSSYSRHMLSNAFVANYQGNRMSLRSVTAYQHFTDKQAVDQDFSALDLVFATQDQLQHMVSQEFTLRSDNNGRYNWVTGLFGFMQILDNDLNIDFGQDAVDMQVVPFTLTRVQESVVRTGGMAMFHQSGLDNFLVQGLSLKAGIRLDYERSELDHMEHMEAGMPAPPPEEFSSELSFFKVLPRLGLTYSLSENSGGFVSVTRGYKTGGFNVVFERDEDRSFDPEHSWNYETGIKGNVLDGRLNYQAALFYIDWKDQQIYQMLPSGQGSMLGNAGKSISRGFELEAHAIPAVNWQLRASYGYTHATFRENSPDPDTDLSGNFIPYIPRHTLHTGINYRYEPLSDLLNAMIFNVSVQGVGRHYWNQENSFYQSWYTRVSGGIDFDLGDFRAGIWARNIGSAGYHAFAFEALGNRYVQKARPLTFGIKLFYGL